MIQVPKINLMLMNWKTSFPTSRSTTLVQH